MGFALRALWKSKKDGAKRIANGNKAIYSMQLIKYVLFAAHVVCGLHLT